MSLTLTAGAAPIFLTNNYCSPDLITAGSKVTASAMEAIADRVVDMDPYAYWQGASADDTVTETLDIPLYVGLAQTVRSDIAFIALLNINLASFNILLSDDNGVSFHTTYTITGNTGANYIKDISAGLKSANLIRIAAIGTIVPNSLKKLGTVVAAGLLLQMTTVPDHPINRSDIENVKVLTMGDGSQNVTYIKRSAASFEFYNAAFQFSLMATTEIDLLRGLRRDNPAFIIYPEPGEFAGEMFYARFNGGFKISPSNEYKGAGYDLRFTVTEIGS